MPEQGTYRCFSSSSLVLILCHMRGPPSLLGVPPNPAWSRPLLESKFNRPESYPVVNGPEQSQESVTAATAPQQGQQGRAGGGGSRGTWGQGSYGGTGEVDGGWGNFWRNPHFMQGTATRPAAGLPGARAPAEPPCQALGRPHLRPETGTAREQVPGPSAWVASGKSATGFRFSLPPGTGLLKDCFGKETAASQETSCTSASNSPWGEGNEGFCIWGQRRKKEDGRFQGRE